MKLNRYNSGDIMVTMEIKYKLLHSTLSCVMGDGRYLMKTEVTMEIEGVDKPAYVAETLSMFVT